MQPDIECPDAAANRGGQWTFDSNQKLFERLNGIVRQPGVELLFRSLSGENLEPGNASSASIGRLNRPVKDPLAGSPNVAAGPITTDERHDRIVRTVNRSVLILDFSAGRRLHSLI